MLVTGRTGPQLFRVLRLASLIGIVSPGSWPQSPCPRHRTTRSLNLICVPAVLHRGPTFCLLWVGFFLVPGVLLPAWRPPAVADLGRSHWPCATLGLAPITHGVRTRSSTWTAHRLGAGSWSTARALPCCSSSWRPCRSPPPGRRAPSRRSGENHRDRTVLRARLAQPSSLRSETSLPLSGQQSSGPRARPF